MKGIRNAVLSLLAAEFGAPYVAIILQVEDPDRIALIAVKNGAKLTETPESENVTVITDPFGSHWAFVKREPATILYFSPHHKRTRANPYIDAFAMPPRLIFVAAEGRSESVDEPPYPKKSADLSAETLTHHL